MADTVVVGDVRRVQPVGPLPVVQLEKPAVPGIGMFCASTEEVKAAAKNKVVLGDSIM